MTLDTSNTKHQPDRASRIPHPASVAFPSFVPPPPKQLCEGCQRAMWEQDAKVRAEHFFRSVIEMFDAKQIKTFTLTPSDVQKLKAIIE